MYTAAVCAPVRRLGEYPRDLCLGRTAKPRAIAAKNKELAQLRTDVPALVRAVNQLTLENQQLRNAGADSGSIVPFPSRASARPRD